MHNCEEMVGLLESVNVIVGCSKVWMRIVEETWEVHLGSAYCSKLETHTHPETCRHKHLSLHGWS
jgi:hypothetical protein